MKYPDTNDHELLAMINESNDDAKDVLFEKYQYIINIIVKKYKKIAARLGVEYNDLYQEALLGFMDAIKDFKDDKETSLPRFITVCVERKLQVVIQKASRIKNKMLADALSLEHFYHNYHQPLMDIIGDGNANNPLTNILKDENFVELSKEIQKSLSTTEEDVYILMIAGLNYNEIAEVLDRNTKQIDNTMQRIRTKVKKLLNQRTKKYH